MWGSFSWLCLVCISPCYDTFFGNVFEKRSWGLDILKTSSLLESRSWMVCSWCIKYGLRFLVAGRQVGKDWDRKDLGWKGTCLVLLGLLVVCLRNAKWCFNNRNIKSKKCTALICWFVYLFYALYCTSQNLLSITSSSFSLGLLCRRTFVLSDSDKIHKIENLFCTLRFKNRYTGVKPYRNSGYFKWTSHLYICKCKGEHSSRYSSWR